MTGPESEAAAQAFIDQRRATVERWTKKPTNVRSPCEEDGEYFAVSYWHGSKMQGRVHVVARSLTEAVEKAASTEKLQFAQGLC
jgi:hypothetical protein